MNDQIIYTDGACSGNPGPGGYACVFPCECDMVLYGYKKRTTNNHMELKAIVSGLKHAIALKRDAESKNIHERDRTMRITINTDSAYIVNAINQGWMDFWKKNDWHTKSNKEIKNIELWKAIDKMINTHNIDVKFIKVKGHKGDKLNEKADYYARLAIKEKVSGGI